MTDFVKIVEVGPRDGLQNEKTPLTLDDRKNLILDLMKTGLKAIEVGSCVSAKWVPQMADSDVLFAQLPQDPNIQFSLLTPNLKGFESALAVGCKEVAVFTAASESFTRKNINCSIDESFEKFADVMAAAKAHNIKVRGYVSCMVDCPYEGAIDPQQVAKVSKRLMDMGCYEVSLGETIGTATPDRVKKVWDAALPS
jgi:hydroxymethylglutaryl-CoA lyase